MLLGQHGIFLDEEAIALLAERNVALIPTLSAPMNILRGGVESGVPGEAVKKTAQVKKSHFKSIVMAKEAEITIAMGTDAGTPFNRHGENLNEIKHMTEIGFSPEQALRAATQTAAKILLLEEELGVIEEGKLADLVAVRGDPLAEIDVLTDPHNIQLVMQAGHLVKEEIQ
jgi:imidazolonepropionase-like amidohydrolase